MTNLRCISDKLGRLRDWRRNEDGGTIIEFTIITPLCLLIVMAIIEWGSIFWIQSNMVNAARQAAREAAQNTNSLLASATVMTTARQRACSWLSGSRQTYMITAIDYCNGLNSEPPDVKVEIAIQAEQASLMNYLGKFTGVSFANAVRMRKELTCPTAVPAAPITCTCNATGTGAASGC